MPRTGCNGSLLELRGGFSRQKRPCESLEAERSSGSLFKTRKQNKNKIKKQKQPGGKEPLIKS